MSDEKHTETIEELNEQFTAQKLDPNAPKLHSKAMRKNWLCVIFGVIALASNAYDVSLSWNLPILPSFDNDVTGGDVWQLSAIQQASNAGAFLAPLTYVPLFDGVGRKHGVLIGTVFAFIGVCVQVFGTFGDNANIAFSVGRVINQFGVAIAGAVANMYIMESSHPAWRAFFGGLFGAVWVWGYYFNQFVVFIATFTPDGPWQWRVPIMMQWIWVATLVALWFIVPETPRFLVSKGKVDEARAVIVEWQADGDASNPMIEAQLEEIQRQIDSEPKFTYWQSINPWPLFRSANYRRRMYILIVNNWVWNLLNLVPSGQVYTTEIYNMLGINNPSVKQGMDIGGDAFTVIGAYYGSFGPERYGRRTLMIWGYGGAVFFLFWQALGMDFYKRFGDSFGWAAVFFAARYISGFWSSLVTAPSANLFNDEIMPFENRARALFVTQFVSSALNFLTTALTPMVIVWLGNEMYWWLFAYSIVQFFTVVLMYPETKGRTLEQVGKIFDSPTPVRHSVKMLKEYEAAQKNAEVGTEKA
ncbi:hypothetical protein HDU84_006830 [Entophlyctis sp. JEL0112]|nr:hypothetical protein HDU84_006830 [Entophlyctis sp. JEL0112]